MRVKVAMIAPWFGYLSDFRPEDVCWQRFRAGIDQSPRKTNRKLLPGTDVTEKVKEAFKNQK
jgi:hypothetical protein